jgi:hypothetical protein
MGSISGRGGERILGAIVAPGDDSELQNAPHIATKVAEKSNLLL